MPVIKQSRIVQYSCSEMFNLVNDVEQYSDFLPYCEESVVHHRDADEVRATLIISVAGFRKSFTTHNRLQADKMIEIRLVSDTLSRLEGFWRFDQVKEGCLISFDLEVEFSSKMISFLFSSVLEQASNQLVDAFCSRAQELYADANHSRV